MKKMKTYNFAGIKINVIDIKTNAVDFRVAEVYGINGRMVHEIRTNAYGKEAAEIAYNEALRFRYI